MSEINIVLDKSKQNNQVNKDNLVILSGESNATDITVEFPKEYLDYSKRVDFLNAKGEKWTEGLYCPEDSRNEYTEDFDKSKFTFRPPDAVTISGELLVQFIAYKPSTEEFVPFEMIRLTVLKSVLYCKKRGRDNPDLIVKAYEYANIAMSKANEAGQGVHTAEQAAVRAQASAEVAEQQAIASKQSADNALEQARQAKEQATKAAESAQLAVEQTGTKVRLNGATQEFIDFKSNPQDQLDKSVADLKELSANIEQTQSQVDKLGEQSQFIPITELVFFASGSAARMLQNLDAFFGYEPSVDAGIRTQMKMLKVYSRSGTFSVSYSSDSLVGSKPTTLTGPIDCTYAIFYPQSPNTQTGTHVNAFQYGYNAILFTANSSQSISNVHWLSIHHGSSQGVFGEITTYSPFPAKIIIGT